MHAFPSISYLAYDSEPTRLARYLLACSVLVIALVSLYPFAGWRMPNQPLFDFFAFPLPHYYTLFDNAINVLAYIPFGYCLAATLGRRWYALPTALLAGALLSGTIEFAQLFLPGRISSNLDILSNAAGSLIGGLLAAIFGSRRWQRLWRLWRHERLAPSSLTEWGFAWLLLWFVSQFDPIQPYLGVVVTPRGLPQPFESPVENAEFFLRLLEGGGMMLNLVGVALYVSLLCRLNAQAPRAITLTLGLALLAKMLFAGMLLKPAQFLSWINLNIVVGGLAGLALIYLVWRIQRRLRALLAFAALLSAQAVSWVWPLSARIADDLPLFRWRYGHIEHFSGLATIIGDLWPLGALLWLLFLAAHPSPDQRWNHDLHSRY